MTARVSTGTIAIVLAGGASSRFGGDKLAVDLDGRPLLHHAIEAVAAVADRVVAVIGPDAPVPVLPPSLADRIVVARDAVPLGGPLAGLAAGLAGVVAAAGDHPPRIALVVGGDMPDMEPAVLGLLVERLDTAAGVVAMTLDASPAAPLPMALLPRQGADAIASTLTAGLRSLRALLDAVPSATIAAADWRRLDPEGRTLRDVDTRGDLSSR